MEVFGCGGRVPAGGFVSLWKVVIGKMLDLLRQLEFHGVDGKRRLA